MGRVLALRAHASIWSSPRTAPLSGSDGCNQLTGSWEVDGSEVDFGELGATMMACEDVDTWLSGAESATVSGDELTVLGADDTEIGTLERST